MERLTLLACVLTLSLNGCALFETPKPVFIKEIEIQEVDVPVIVRPSNPPVLVRPDLPIDQLREEDNTHPGIVVQKYRATVKALIGYTEELEAIINGFRY